MTSRWITIGAALMALAIITGAFGAHALKQRLDPYYLDVFEKGVFYHALHALGILLVATLMQSGALAPERGGLVCLLLLSGIVLFSGSLYLLSVLQIPWLGMITPVGGVTFIAGWIVLAATA